MSAASEPVEVWSGVSAGGLRWTITTAGDERELLTLLTVFRGDRIVAGSGFGGAALPPGNDVNEWRGRTDDLPYFVMVRTAPHVERVVATTDRGTQVEVVLSPVVEPFGLRFGAAALPDGEGPGSLRAESGGVDVARLEQRRPPGW